MYIETQRFTQVWLWVLLLIFAVTFLRQPISSLFSAIFLEQGSPVDIPRSGYGLVMYISQFVLVLAIFLLFGFSKLKTIINEDGIKVKFGWLMRKYRTINWDEVDEVFIRKFNAIDDYCGYGIKQGPKGKALIVRGNKGMQLFLSSGEKLLIGTQKQKELQSFLEKNIFNKFDTIVS